MELLVVLVRMALLGLFGPELLVIFHQQAQEICNGTIYSH
jgi:hypothetical protein